MHTGNFVPVNISHPYMGDELKWEPDAGVELTIENKESEQNRLEEQMGGMLKRYYQESINAERLKDFDVCYGFFGNCHKIDL